MAAPRTKASRGKSGPSNRARADLDVLIVGGGPAGCAAGILLAREGIRTTLLEREPRGHHKICGDLLGVRSLRILETLDIGWASMVRDGWPIEGIQVLDEKGLKSVAYLSDKSAPDPVGVTLKRDRLDRFLQEKAIEAGCEILYGVRFQEFVAREGDAVLCRASKGEEDLLFRARLVFGADGASSTTARAAGLFRRTNEGMLLAVRGYYRGIDRLRNTIELYPLSSLQPGYAWVIPLNRESANVGLGLRADVCRRDGVRLRRELRRFIAEHPVLSKRMRHASQEADFNGWPLPAYGSVPSVSGERVLLLGDAAGFVDPISGEGIFSAMQSARLAVETARDALRQGVFGERFLARYDERCRRCFGPDFGSAAFLTGFLAHPPLGRPLAMWGLKQVEKNCLLDQSYARMVAGFFTGTCPRKRFLKPKWLVKTLLG